MTPDGPPTGVDDDPPDDALDEELDRRRDPRRLPRWAVLVAAALLVLGAGTLIVRSERGTERAAPGPTDSARPQLPRLTLPDDSVVVPTGDGRLLYFTGAVLSIVDPFGRVIAERRYPNDSDAAQRRQSRLLVDGYAGTVWVVSMDGVEPGHADKFSYDSLEPLDRVALPAVAGDIAAVGGDLYITTDNGLWELARLDDRFTRVASGHVVRVVADNVDQRPLLLTRDGDKLTLVEFGARPQTAPAPALAPEPDLVTVDGYVWGVGSLDGRAWIARLDPRTLRFGPNRAPDGYDRSAILAGTGDHSLFLQVGLDVDCFDLAGSRIVERFPGTHGPVAATRRRAVFSEADGAVRSRPLGRCVG